MVDFIHMYHGKLSKCQYCRHGSYGRQLKVGLINSQVSCLFVVWGSSDGKGIGVVGVGSGRKPLHADSCVRTKKTVELPTFQKKWKMIPLPGTNIASEIRPSQKQSSLPTIHFQLQFVSFREGIPLYRGYAIEHLSGRCANLHPETTCC